MNHSWKSFPSQDLIRTYFLTPTFHTYSIIPNIINNINFVHERFLEPWKSFPLQSPFRTHFLTHTFNTYPILPNITHNKRFVHEPFLRSWTRFPFQNRIRTYFLTPTFNTYPIIFTLPISTFLPKKRFRNIGTIFRTGL